MRSENINVAVLTRDNEIFSVRTYIDNIIENLSKLGVKFKQFGTNEAVPNNIDLLWDPGLGMRRVLPVLRKPRIPLLVTVHGVRVFSIPITESARTVKQFIRGYLNLYRVINSRKWMQTQVSAAIAVSEFGAQEVMRAFKTPPNRVFPIHHGVDHNVFNQNGKAIKHSRPFFLQIAQSQPKKNTPRIVNAYRQLPENTRPDLILILPNSNEAFDEIPGLKVIRTGMSQVELARWYRSALCLLIPSLHETFGLPIIEAMACGCPVITSNVTACPEVAGDAAMLVDPRSVDQIVAAMKTISGDKALQKALQKKGLIRSLDFTWKKSSDKHLNIFNKAIASNSW